MADWSQNNASSAPRRKWFGCGCGGSLIAIIIVVATVGGIGIAIASIFAPDTLSQLIGGLSGLPVKQSQAITGDPRHFDPISAYAEAHDFAAKDAQLVEFTAYFVSSDGTMDLTATYSPAPRAEYKFVEPTAAPSNAPPVGAGGSVTAKWYLPITVTAYQPGQRQNIREVSGGTSLEYTFVNKGYSREVSSVNNNQETILPPPICNLGQMWKIAIQSAGAPSNAVATITYRADGYEFEITGTDVSLKFGMDCKLAESSGSSQ